MADIESLERKIVRVESLLILLAVAAIASGDYFYGPSVSLGYLYLVPLSYSALTHRLRTTVALVVCCVILRQWFGPLERSPWALIARDWALTGVFFGVVVTLHQLGKARRQFFYTARRQRDELVREVRLAAEVQRQLLENHQPPAGRFDIVTLMEPARGVGGDYYDFLMMRDGCTGIVIADVAGKGLPAALLMPAVQIALRALAERLERVEEVVRQLNQILFEAFGQANYATLFLGALHPETGRFRYVNAGHLPGLLLQPGQQRPERLEAGGTPVGLLPAAEYESAEVTLQPDSVLVLYTDGVTEAENERREQFGDGRLTSLLRHCRTRSARLIVEGIRSETAAFRSHQSWEDDLTLIVVKAPSPLSAP